MARLSTGSLMCGVFVLAGSLTASAAQAPQGQARGGGAPQPPPQNLQVLPKDMARAQVVTIMQNFSAALGVTCNHCHVFNGPGDPMNDFAGDTKPTKNIARAMMLMVREINPTVQKAVTSKAADQVAQGAHGLQPRLLLQRPAEGGVGLHQLLGAQVHGALQHGPVVVELAVGGVDRVQEGHAVLGHPILAPEEAEDLPGEEAVALFHRQRSARVVMAMVWLCSSHRASGVNGEISP